MKKLIALFLSLMLVFSLAACGNSQQTENTVPSTSEANVEPAASEEPADDPSETETEGSGGKTLVVYYSATGSTENVAKVIADATGADLFELEPVDAYSSEDLDWTDDGSRVNFEHENESERAVELVAATVDNWNDYDTVFIGA